MFSVDDALNRILAEFQPLPAETVHLAAALGRVLAQPITAPHDLPTFPNSAMDGYAVRAEDTASAAAEAPVTLRVVGDIPAGTFPKFSLQAGEAARIMTGAPIPHGADAVVPYEQTDDRTFQFQGRVNPPPAEISIMRAFKRGESLRARGEDVRVGELILSAGRVLRAADLGILAGLGIPQVAVTRRPRVAVISTGDELLPVDQPLTDGKIHDMNGYTLTALATQLGTEANYLGIAGDSLEDVLRLLDEASAYDVILSSAGVSVGALDVVKTAVEMRGSLGFWRVNIRPGKPLAFGRVSGKPYFGLPGNPVSAMVTFDVFVRPALRKLLGIPSTAETTEYAELAEPMTSDGRRTYVRVALTRRDGRLFARSTGTQSSGAISSLVYADGLLILPEGVTEASIGQMFPVRVFRDGQ